MKAAQTQMQSLSKNNPASKEFHEYMKFISEEINGTFANVNLNGITQELNNVLATSDDIQKWVKEAEKIATTLNLLKDIQIELGSKGKSLELFNPSQINQLLDFVNSKNLIAVKQNIETAKENAQNQSKQIRGQYFYSSIGDIENAIKKRKIRTGEQDVWKDTSDIFTIEDESKISASSKYELSVYQKTADLIRQIIKEKQELGEIKTVDDAEKNLALTTELNTAYKQLLQQETYLKGKFTVKDKDGNVIKQLYDPQKLLTASLSETFKDINFDDLLHMQTDATKLYEDYIKGVAEAAYKRIQKQLFDKVEQMVGKSVSRATKKGEQTQGILRGRRSKIDEGGSGGDGTGGSTGGGTGSGDGTSGGTGASGSGQPQGEINVDVKPNAKNVVGDIQKQVNGQEVEVEVKPRDKSFDEIFKKWRTQNIADNKEKPELGMLFNTKTGDSHEILNKIVGGLPQKMIDDALNNTDFKSDSFVHSHPNELFGAFSFDDIQRAIQHKTQDIIYECVASINDISVLDLSKFSEENLRDISNEMKKIGIVSDTGDADWYVDEVEYFNGFIKDNLSEYVDIALSQLSSQLKSNNVDDGAIQNIVNKTKEQFGKIKADKLQDFDGFYDNLYELIIDNINDLAPKLASQFAEGSNRISVAESIADLSVTSASNVGLQRYIEKSLIDAISSIRPDLNIPDVYKKISWDDYFSGVPLFGDGNQGTSGNSNGEVDVNIQKLKEQIESLEQQVIDLQNKLESLQRTDVAVDGIEELQNKLKSAEQYIESLRDALAGSVDSSSYNQVVEDLSNAEDEVRGLKHEIEDLNQQLADAQGTPGTKTGDIRSKIDDELEKPFEIKLEPKTNTLRSDIDNELEKPFEVNLETKTDTIRSDINKELNKPFEVNLETKTDTIRSDINKELQTPFEAKVETKSDGVRDNINEEIRKPFKAKINPDTSSLRDHIDDALVSPFNINVEPNKSLRKLIEDLLNQPFDINLNGKNISVDNATVGGHSKYSPSKDIFDMMQADLFMNKHYNNTGADDHKSVLKERALFFNSETGEHTNPFIFDNKSSMRVWEILNEFNKDKKYDVGMHSHPEKWAHMSIDNEKNGRYSGDLTSFRQQLDLEGIKKQIIAAQHDVQIFDAEGFFKKYGKKFSTDKIEQATLKKFSELQQEYVNSMSDSYKPFLNLMEQIVKDGEELTIDFSDFAEVDTTFKMFNKKDVSQRFLQSLRNQKDESASLVSAVQDFVYDYINQELGLGTDRAMKAVQSIGVHSDKFIDWANNNFWKGHGARGSDFLVREATSRAFKDLGIDWDAYNKYYSIDEFKDMYGFSDTNGRVSGNQSIDVDVNTDSIQTQIQQAVSSGSPYKADIEINQNDVATQVAQAIGYGEPYPITSMEIDSMVGLPQQIQDQINSKDKPYLVKVDLDPSSNLVGKIQDALQKADFNIDVAGGNNKNDSEQGSSLSGDQGQNQDHGKNLNNDSNQSSISIPQQTFDNEVQQNLVSLENYKNTIAEIDKLKLEPETDETKAKLEELNTLADYFASKITAIRGEGGTIDGTFMRDPTSGGFSDKLRQQYTNEQLTQMEQVARERYGISYRMETPQFTKIKPELDSIEAKSEEMKQSLRNSLLESKSYVEQLKRDLIDLIDTKEELSHEPQNSKWFGLMQQDVEKFSNRSPEILQLADSLTSGQAMDFVKSDGWLDFLATLPKAHDYLESIGYDFEKIKTGGDTTSLTGEHSNQGDRSTGSIESETKALKDLKNVIENEIPAAIQTKNEAFQGEVDVVQSTVNNEVESFNLLIKTLSDVGENIAALDQFFSEMGSDTNTFNGLLQNLSNVGETLAALDSFFVDFKDTLKQTGTGTGLNSLKFSKQNIENIDKLRDGIVKLVEALNRMDQGEINTPLFSSINDLLKNADELKNLAEILSHSKKEIDGAIGSDTAGRSLNERIRNLGFSDSEYNEIIKAINTPDYALSLSTAADGAYERISKLRELLKEFKYEWKATEDTDAFSMEGAINSTDDVERAIEEFKELESCMSEYLALKKIVDNPDQGTGALNDTQRQRWFDLSKMYEHATKTAQQYGDTVKELSDAQEKFNKTQKDVVEYQNKQDAKTTQNTIDRNLKKTQDRLSKISDLDKNRWASQYGDLEAAINNANEAFKQNNDVDEYTKSINEAFDAFRRFQKMPSGRDVGMASSFDDAKSYFENLVHSYKTVLKDISGDTTIGADGMAHFSAQVRDAEGNVQKLSLAWDSVNKQMVLGSQQMPKQLVGISGVIDGIKNKIKELATYWTARFFDPMDIMRYARQVFSIIQQYDDALTEMRKVSDESVSSLKNFQIESFSKANEVGTTALQLQQSTADWLRLGEDFEEAQKSAETSNILLNVSEFSNIDEATQALTSASQAYKEFEKIDIVDKLNNIGNNFSISTDQLAQGLQNAAAVLKTQGNDLDQSLALLTAGNAITQDISKTSAGIRTIALRISGTEEAKDEIKDMGEDVDDFVVRTRSKTDQIIRDYTAVASNMYQGVSVLDPNGNLRDTYDILLDIAEIYEEIQKEDKQRGTNKAQALVETLAGKNRSNIAASILNNPQMLKDVYAASQQSQGSAQEELDKYLDSISGKMQKLTNQVQELANIAINSDGLKVMLDVVNALLSGVTALGKQFGVLNTVIGGFMGIFLQNKGIGFLPNKKGEGGWGAILNGWFTKKPPTRLVEKRISRPLSKYMEEAFSKIDLEGDFFGQLMDIGIDEQAIEGFGDFALDQLIEKLGGVKEGAISAADAKDELSNTFAEIEEPILDASGILESFTDGLKQMGSALLTSAVSMVALMAVEGLIKMFYDLATAEQRAIEKGKEAKQVIADINENYSNKTNFVDDNFDNYLKLREGTKTTKDGGIQNISLANEEYEEFIAINQELANLFPSLVTSYDAQGNAILNLSNNTDEATNSISNLLEQERQLADFQVGEQLGVAVTGFATRYKQLQKDIKEQDDFIDATHELQSAIEDKMGDEQIDLTKFGIDEDGTLRWEYDTNDPSSQKIVDKISNLYTEAAQSIYKDVDYSGSDSTAGLLVMNMADATAENVEALQEAFKAKIQEASLDDIPEEILESMSIKNKDLSEIKADWNGLVPSIISQLNLYDNYQKLGDSKIGEQMQQIISDDIANMNLDLLTEDEWELFGDNPRQFVKKRFLDPIYNALYKDGELNKENQKTLQELIDFDGSDLTNEDYRKTIARMVASLTDNKEYREQIKIMLGFEYVDETGAHWDVTKRRNELFDLINSDAEGNEQLKFGTNREQAFDMFKHLTQGDFDALEYAMESMNVDLSTLESWQDLINLIQKAKEEMEKTPELEKDGTLSSIFIDEQYQVEAEKHEKHLSSLTGALSTLREEGTLTAEAMKNLQEEFPDLTEFSKESIGDAALKELSGWIDLLKKDIDTLSPEGMEQLLTYANNLNMSFGDLGVSAQEAKQAVQDSIVDIYASYGKQQEQSAQATYAFNDLVQQIEDSGQEVNWQIVWELGMMDRFSDPATNIYEEYNNLEMIWKIKVDADQAISDIQSNIDKRNKEISRLEAENNLKEASGQYLSEGDYVSIWRNQHENYKDAQGKTKIRQGAIDAANRIKNSVFGFLITDKYMDTLEGDLIDAQSEEINDRIEMLNTIKAQTEAGANKYTSALTKAQNYTEKRQSEIDRMNNDGIAVDQKFYDSLAEGFEEQAKENEILRAYWQAEADKDTTPPELKNEYQSKANDYESAVISANESAFQARTHFLEDYSNKLTDLQGYATKYQNQITDAEARHQKVSDKTYTSLIKNGTKQIANLRQQRKSLQDLQKEVQFGSQKWRDYQSQIDSIDSSISQMQNDQIGWFEQMNSLISSNASALSSAIQSAFSEINSSTGLTIETMQELSKQFSDIAGYDVSNIFYQSADGMKFNADAAEFLVDAEYQLEQASLREIIATNQKIAADQTATASAREQANARIEAAQRELSMLQSLYDQQKQQFTRFAGWQAAQSTENSGANYEAIQGYLKTQQEAFTKGLTGTDETKAYTKYFDQWGMDTVDSWKRNKDKVVRYMTEDITGIQNFLSDMEKNGLAELSDEGFYRINVDDWENAANTMGMSLEWFRDMMNRTEDYGARVNWVESSLDGEMQIRDMTNDLIDQQIHLQELQRNGAPQDVIDNQKKQIEEMKSDINNIRNATETVSQKEGKVTASEIRDQIRDIFQLRKEWKKAATDYEKEEYEKRIQSLADEYQIPLTGELTIDNDAIEEIYPGYKADITLNPILAENADLEGGNGHNENAIVTDSYDAALQKTKDNWEGNEEALQGYLDTLSKYNVEDLESIDAYDHKWDENYKDAEEAIGGIRDILGLTGEEGKNVIAILEEIGVLSRDYQAVNEKSYKNPLGKKYEHYTGSDITDVEELFENRNIPVSVDFDVENSSAEELSDYINELQRSANLLQLQGFSDSPAFNQLQSFISSLEKEYEFKVKLEEIDSSGISLDELANMEYEDFVANCVVEMDETEFDEVKARIQNDTIKAQIQAKIDSGETNLETLQSMAGDELHNYLTTTLNIDVKGTEDLEALINELGQTQSITVQLDDTQFNRLEELLDRSEEGIEVPVALKMPETLPTETIQTTQTIGMTHLETPKLSQPQPVAQTVETPSEQSVDMVVNVDDKLVDEKLQEIISKIEDADPEIKIDGNHELALAKANVAVGLINEKEATITIDGDNSLALAKADVAVGLINLKTGTINVDARTDTLINKIDTSLASRQFTINVSANVSSVSGLPGGATPSNASGTLSRAHATGTIPAHSSGVTKDGKLKQDEYALVNEVANEGLVRDGQLYEIPGGAHMEHLKKGDIIFSGQQMDELKKTGKVTSGGGRGKAYADGTGVKIAPAHSSEGFSKQNAGGATIGSVYMTKQTQQQLNNLGNAAQNAANATNANTATTSNNTGAKKEEQKAAEESTQTFDWVEKKLSALADVTEAITSKITDWISIGKKVSLLGKEIDSINQEIKAQTKAAQIYNDKANEIAKSYEYKVSSGNHSGSNTSTTTTTTTSSATKDEIEKELKKYMKGGNVDLLNRPQIDASKLKKAGFADAGSGTATVFTSTFSNYNKGKGNKNSVAMNFTPILPDGTVMEQKSFTEYCEEVVNGTRKDTKHLQIGSAFFGEDAIEQAVDAAEKIHELQDDYYLGGNNTTAKSGQKIKVSIPKEYQDLVKNGRINEVYDSIEEMDTSSDEKKALAEAIGKFEEYIQKAKDAAKAVQELRVKSLEAFEGIANAPIDRATKRVDLLANRYSGVTAAAESIGGQASLKYTRQNIKDERTQKTISKDKDLYLIQNELLTQQNAETRGDMQAWQKAETSALKRLEKEQNKYNKIKSQENDANEQVAKSERELNKLRKNKNTSPEKLAKAEKKLSDAKLASAKVGEQVEYQEQRVTIARNAATEATNNARDAEAKWTQAQAEYYKTRAENITNFYTPSVDLGKAQRTTSESIVDYYNSIGRAPAKMSGEQTGIEREMKFQVSTMDANLKVLKEYQHALWGNAEDARKEYGENSNEYKELLTEYEGLRNEIKEEMTAREKLKLQIYELKFKPIQDAIDMLDKFANKLDGVIGLYQQRGTHMEDGKEVSYDFEPMMNQQVSTNNSMIEYWDKYRSGKLQELRDHPDWEEGSDNYKAVADEIANADDNIIKLLQNNENLKKSIREVRWKPFNDMDQMLQRTQSDMGHLMGMIDDAEMFDELGEGWHFTDKGIANMALLSNAMAASTERAEAHKEALKKLDEEYANGNINLDEYNQYSREHLDIIQQEANATRDYKKQIVDMYKKQITNETNAIKKLIAAQKELLSTQKAYHDYDRTMRDKNKSVHDAQARVNALQGVDTIEAKAELARLEAQLHEAQDDRDETVYQHSMDKQMEDLDKLSDKVDETLQNTLKKLDSNSVEQEKIVVQFLGRVQMDYETAYSTINDVIAENGTAVSKHAQNVALSMNGIKENADMNKGLVLGYLSEVDGGFDNLELGISGIETTVDGLKSRIGEMASDAKEKLSSVIDAVNKVSTTKIKISTEGTKQAEKNVTGNDPAKSANSIKDSKVDEQKAIEQGKEDQRKAQEAEQQRQAELAQKRAQAEAQRTAVQKKMEDQKKEIDRIAGRIKEVDDKLTAVNKEIAGIMAIPPHKRTLQQSDQLQRLNEKVSLYQGAITSKQTMLKKAQSKYNELEEELKKIPSYSSGTKNAKGLSWTHDDEIIIRKTDGAVLTPLSTGDMVFTKQMSQNLWNLSQIDWAKMTPNGINVGNVPSSQSQQVINPVMNYNPVINGAGLSEQQLAAILKKERDEAFKDFTNRIVKDYKQFRR